MKIMYLVMAGILAVGLIGGGIAYHAKGEPLSSLSYTLGQSRDFVSAARTAGNTVTYTAKDGTKVKYKGGTLAWRTNNPGNIWAGKISKKFGSIGKYNNFAIFASIEDGRSALKGVLTITMKNMTIVKAMRQYAPPHENNTKAYTAFVVKAIGRPSTTLVKDLTDAELDRMIKAIEHVEGFRAGTIIKL